MNAQHTPGPWERDGIFLTVDGVIVAKALYSVEGPSAEVAFANARRIERCVNAHDELVAAFRKAALALGANSTLLEEAAQGLDSTNKLRANEIRATARMLRWHADEALSAIAKATGSTQ